MSSTFKPVVLILPERRSGNSCGRPIMVNGLAFDLSAPSRIIHVNPSSADNQTTPSCDDIATSIPESAVQFQSENNSVSESGNKISTTRSDNGVIRHEDSSLSNTDMSKVTLYPPNGHPSPLKGRGSVGLKPTSHNEVEKRRKLKISTCIRQLSQCLPFKIFGKVSHGDVLEKVTEHIQNLKRENDSLSSKISSLADTAEVQSMYVNLLLEHILLKELHRMLEGEEAATSHEVTDRSCDSVRESHNMTEKSHNIQEKSHEKQSAGFISSARDSSKVVGETPLPLSTPTSVWPITVQRQTSVSHQPWPVVSLLSDTHGSSSNSILSSSPFTSPPPSQTSGLHVGSTGTLFSHSLSLCNSYEACTTDIHTQPIHSSIQTSSPCSDLTQHLSNTSSSHRPQQSTITTHTHIVQPWVDARSTENSEQSRIQTSSLLQDVEIGTPSTQCPAYTGSGLIDNCTSEGSSTNYLAPPAIVGSTRVSADRHFLTRTSDGMRRVMDIGNSFKPSQDLLPTISHQIVDSDPFKVGRQRYSRHKPYTSVSRRNSRPDSTAMTEARQLDVSGVPGCSHTEQLVQESGRLRGFSNQSVSHSISYSEPEDRTFSVDYDDEQMIGHAGPNENYRYPLHQMTSHDNHVMSYNTPAILPYPEVPVPIPPADGSVWRPYSEPHRLSDILPHSGPGSNHALHHHDPTHPHSVTVNRMHSFLVNRLLDDI